MESKPQPYLSIVIVGRNDNYGGDFKLRLQACLDHTVTNLISAKIPSEIIFVNYNPIPESSIENFIVWGKSNGYVSIRMFTVSHSIHEQLIASGNRKNVPVLEYLAKNVGIRRATGEYILCMNPDILLPEDFFTAVHSLKPNAYYKANRIDFKSFDRQVPSGFLRLHLKGHAHEYSSHSFLNYHLCLAKNYFLCTWKLYSGHFEKLFDFLSWKVYYNNVEFKFHCNAAGDFMLMHRDKWFELKGYNEQTRLSLHVDALMVIQAAMSGLHERVIASPVYHLEHERRYNSDTDNPEQLQAYQFFQTEAQQMFLLNKPKIYNDEDWGLSNFDLPKIEI